MVANTLDHGACARVPDGEALASNTAEISFASDRPVEHHVAGDDILGRLAAELRRRLHRDATAREALAAIIVSVADEVEGDALRQECAEALSRGAREPDVYGVVRQAVMAVTLGNLP